MKRLLIFASMLALATGCATSQNAGAPESNLPAGTAYLYPDVPPGVQGREAAAITPPILTDSGYVNTGTSASAAMPAGAGAAGPATYTATSAGASGTATAGETTTGAENIIPLGTTIYSFGNNGASGSPAYTTTTTTGAATGSATTGPISEKDQRFVRDASQGARAQITLGQMILQKSSSDDMRSLGQRLIDDNTRAYDQLSQIAGQKNITIANAPSDRMQDILNRMSTQGSDFNESAVRNARRGSGRQADLYTWGSTSAQDPDLRAFAQQNVGPVQQNHAQAQQVEDSMGIHH